ncbi:CHAT domain-containing protein [cf. Phormidesmis sp. LEGE 11477]|uniref:CHAT domain-containing protein n=1 Tax=cf. Phormidesmis sp. LEGE 11477 TaxID=1828680 RepID=UPI00187E7AAF|nr:CHAT domain-containing protein [cf. Phormidesmis sp. LEGE 11477]MBE9062651.1 CHAT domain-containing protein [cf. Phormidesmis sp. LEGE 11477]
MKFTQQHAVAVLLGISLVSSWAPSTTAANQLATDVDRVERTSAGLFSEAVAAPLEPMAAGRQLYSSGQFSAAVEAWQTALDTAEVQGDELTQIIAHSYLSLAYQALSQWDLAEIAIGQSMELLENSSAEAISPILQAQVLNTKAGLIYHLGQAELSYELWQQAEGFYQQAKDVSGVLGSQINQAQALQSLGYYRRSRQQLEDISQRLRTMPDSALKANGLRSLGTALRVLGDLESSRSALFESANIAVDIDATNELSATYLSLGSAAADWGDPAAAIAMFERAKREARNPTDALQANLERLRFYVNSADAEQSASTANEIATQLEKLPPSRLSVYAAVSLSASLAREEILGKSLPIARQNQLLANAVSSARALNDPQAEAHALNQWGALYSLTKQWSEALKLTEQSLAIARSIQADDIVSQSAWQLGRILKQQNNMSEAILAYSEAVDSLQALRSDLVAVDPDVQFSFRENVEPIYRELVSLLLETDSSGRKNAAQPSQKNLAQAREVIEALQLAELDNFFQEACIDVASQQIDQVDAQATIIYPIILPDRLAVIASTPGQPLEYYSTSVSAKTVEATLRELLSATHPASDNEQRLALSQQVYDWLIKPAEERQITTDTETMVFVLDGLLRNVPIAALYDGDQYLIEKYAVALSPGLQLMSAQALDEIDTNAVAGGISEARNGLSALPAVETELSDISELITTDTLLNEAFTSDALANHVKNSTASIVHLATHGQFSSRLEDTFLSTWEGRLNVKELSEILQTRDSSNAIELLVLSACDTASGDDRAVLGLAGLAVQSGARSTIATLWPVKDQAAAKLMQALYEGISESGMSKAEALRQAQLKLLNDPSYSDPFFWSAYTLVGNWN